MRIDAQRGSYTLISLSLFVTNQIKYLEVDSEHAQSIQWLDVHPEIRYAWVVGFVRHHCRRNSSFHACGQEVVGSRTEQNT